MQNGPEIIKSPDKKDKIDELLSSFGIVRGEPVPSAKFREVVLAKEKEITEGLARNFYRSIKQYLYVGRMQPISSPNYLIRRQPYQEGDPTLDFVWFLESIANSNADKWKQGEEYKIIFTYSAPKDRVTKEMYGYHPDRFSGEDAFRLEKISEGAIPLSELNDRKIFAKRPDVRDTAPKEEKDLSYENVKNFLANALKSAEYFEDTNKALDEVWKKYNFSVEDKEKLKKAVWEFGNYEFHEREGKDVAGWCMTISGGFESFVRDRYGINLKNCELTGARQTRESYSPEERAELDAEQSESEVHVASIYKDTVIIDWTSRQFGHKRSAALPEVVDLNMDEALKSRIEISK